MTSGPAPDFEIENLDGEACPSRDLLDDRQVLLVFFKVACPTCQLAFPFLERLHARREAGRGPRIVGISQDAARATREFAARYGITFPLLIDPSGCFFNKRFPASNAFQISSVPSGFLIAPDRSISLTFCGFEKAKLEQLGGLCGVEVFAGAGWVPELRPG